MNKHSPYILVRIIYPHINGDLLSWFQCQIKNLKIFLIAQHLIFFTLQSIYIFLYLSRSVPTFESNQEFFPIISTKCDFKFFNTKQQPFEMRYSPESEIL